jgi:hypothetical protein
MTKFPATLCPHTSCVEGQSSKLNMYYPNFLNICKNSPNVFHMSRWSGMPCYSEKEYIFLRINKGLCHIFLNPLCVCSKSNSIIFFLSLSDPVSLSLSTALHTYFPHPSSSLSQAFIHIFLTSLSLSLSGTSHSALIYRFWKWQPDILDDIGYCLS